MAKSFCFLFYLFLFFYLVSLSLAVTASHSCALAPASCCTTNADHKFCTGVFGMATNRQTDRASARDRQRQTHTVRAREGEREINALQSTKYVITNHLIWCDLLCRIHCSCLYPKHAPSLFWPFLGVDCGIYLALLSVCISQIHIYICMYICMCICKCACAVCRSVCMCVFAR